MSLKAVRVTVLVSAILAIRLNAGAMDLAPETSIFNPPLLSGFEDLTIAPALTQELPPLVLEAFAETESDEDVSSADWTNTTPQNLPHSTSIPEPLWAAERQASIDTLKVTLGGITALLSLALLGLAVSFFTMRAPANLAGPVKRPEI